MARSGPSRGIWWHLRGASGPCRADGRRLPGEPQTGGSSDARGRVGRGERRRGMRTTRVDQSHCVVPDRVERQFQADAPDRLWVADVTYVPTWTGFVYLAIVLDVFSRRVVGWFMTHHLRTELVLGALNMALGQRRPDGVVHHSDRGSQYTSLAFGKRCREMGVVPSTGSAGDCVDNAMAGELLCHAGVRAHRPALVPYPGRSAPGDLPIHRRLVQPTPSSFSPGLPQPQRLRAVRGEGNATCSAQRSSSGSSRPGASRSSEPKVKTYPPGAPYLSDRGEDCTSTGCRPPQGWGRQP